MCNTSFCLTVKKVIAEVWFDDYFSFFFSLGFTKPETGSTWKILWDVGCSSQKRWMGTYWKLYLQCWLSLDLKEASSLTLQVLFIWSFHWAECDIAFSILFIFIYFLFLNLSLFRKYFQTWELILVFSSCLSILGRWCQVKHCNMLKYPLVPSIIVYC